MSKWIVCPDCNGEGKHVLHGAALTAQDIWEWGGDEFVDDMLAGAYDTVCDTCQGRTTIREDDLDEYHAEAQDARMRWYESGCPA